MPLRAVDANETGGGDREVARHELRHRQERRHPVELGKRQAEAMAAEEEVPPCAKEVQATNEYAGASEGTIGAEDSPFWLWAKHDHEDARSE